MRFNSLILAGVSIILAGKSAYGQQNITRAQGPFFLLKTILTDPNDGGNASSKADKWLSPYHTGAAIGDTVLTANRSKALVFWQNGTEGQIVTTYAGFDLAIRTWSFTNYDKWSSIAYTPGDGDTGYTFTDGKLTAGTDSQWLGCDWAFGVPQLFYGATSVLSKTYLPSSCAKIDLLREDIEIQNRNETDPPCGEYGICLGGTCCPTLWG